MRFAICDVGCERIREQKLHRLQIISVVKKDNWLKPRFLCRSVFVICSVVLSPVDIGEVELQFKSDSMKCDIPSRSYYPSFNLMQGFGVGVEIQSNEIAPYIVARMGITRSLSAQLNLFPLTVIPRDEH